MRNPIEFIEDLQKKPESARRSIAIVSTALIMAVIMGIWITTFSISSPYGISADASQADTPSPFALIFNFIKESVF